MSVNSRFKIWIEKELEKIKGSFPSERITLAEAIRGRLEVKSRNGSIIRFSREDVEELKNIVPRHLWDKVRLPILIVKNPELGSYHYEVYCTDIEREIISKILGLEGFRGEKLIISFEEVEHLLKKFKSLIYIGLVLGISRVLED